MLKMIDSVLESDYKGGDSPRDAIFELQRPCIEHLEVPLGMDLAYHWEQKEKADKVFEPDSDDDEAGVPSGRISPCTFLAWSKNCKRWDEGDIKEYPDKVSEILKKITPLHTSPHASTQR